MNKKKFFYIIHNHNCEKTKWLYSHIKYYYTVGTHSLTCVTIYIHYYIRSPDDILF